MKKFLTDEEMAELEAKSVPQTLSNKKFLTDEEMAKLEAMQKPSVTSSALRGAAQGVTFGFSDEIAGAAEAAYDVATTDKKLSDLKDLYRQRRDESRELNEIASRVNPKAYTAGEITGGLASSIFPVGAAGRGVGALSKLGTVGKVATTGAAIGGVSGAGYSEEETIRGTLADMAIGATTGAALGAATGAAGKAMGKLIEKAPEAVKAKGGEIKRALDTVQLGKAAGVDEKTIDKLNRAINKEMRVKATEAAKEGAITAGKGLAGFIVGDMVGGELGGMLGAGLAVTSGKSGRNTKEALKEAAKLFAARPSSQKAYNSLLKILTGKDKDAAKAAAAKLRAEGFFDKAPNKTKKGGSVNLEKINYFEGSDLAPAEHHYSVVKDGKPVGRVIVWDKDPKSIHEAGKTGSSLKDIRLDPELRGKGNSRQVIDALVSKHGPLSSDTRGNISEAGKKMLDRYGKKTKDLSGEEFFILDKDTK